MATKIDQKAYLQKYLSGPSGEKKKKKKKVTKGSGFKIIDDDLDLSKLRPLEGDELDILGEGEDAPQIAGIIDERPEEVKKLEQFKTTSKWRVINQDDGFNSKLQIEEIKKDVKEVEKENQLIFGKMYSDSEDEQKQDSDLSPPRKQNANEKGTRHDKSKKPANHSDSDFSPPRKRKDETLIKSKSDMSTTKKKAESKSKRKHQTSDSDPSPPRKTDKSKITKNKDNKTSDSDLSPRRKTDKSKITKNKDNKTSDTDLSPPRKTDKSKITKNKDNKTSDSDLSPPRNNTKSKERVRKASRWGDFKEEEEKYKRDLEKRRDSPLLYQRSSRSPDREKTRKKPNKSPDSDLSPPRKSNKNSKNYDSDLSPPRKRKFSPDRQGTYTHSKSRSNDRHSNTKSSRYDSDRYNNQGESRKHSKDFDYNRRKPDSSGHSPSRDERSRVNDKRYNRIGETPPPTNKKMEKTLEGKKAGLQDAVQLRQENEAFRRREEEVFSKMTDDISGRNAQVVSRKGKRETSEERKQQKDKADKQKELDDKYKKWGKGLKQIEEQEKRVQDFMHEASKPLARHKGDADLENRLKDTEREGDPMLQYIRGKKQDKGELGPEKPTYKGSFPPNRFNIRPGYRWDGVDRSNGYEKKFFDQQSKRKAQAQEAYKWSTEDL